MTDLSIIEFISNFVKHETRNYFQALAVDLHFLRLTLIFFRCWESFQTIACINLAAVWVFLSHRYVQTRCWRTDCTCESQSWRCDHQRLALLQYSRYQPSQIFRTIKLKEKLNIWCSEFLSTRRSNVLISVVSLVKMTLVCFGCSFKTSICRHFFSIYNLMVISSLRKLSNYPSWSTTRIVRSVTLRMIGR